MEKYPFFLFLRKMLMSAFLLIFKANYDKKMHGYSLFFFVDSNRPYKDLLFPHGSNLAQKPLYLVGTNLSHRYLYNFILYID